MHNWFWITCQCVERWVLEWERVQQLDWAWNEQYVQHPLEMELLMEEESSWKDDRRNLSNALYRRADKPVEKQMVLIWKFILFFLVLKAVLLKPTYSIDTSVRVCPMWKTCSSFDHQKFSVGISNPVNEQSRLINK